MLTPPRQGHVTATRARGPNWQLGLLSRPLPEGVVLCLCCPWADHSATGPDPAVEHTRRTGHPTVHQPRRTSPEPPHTAQETPPAFRRIRVG